MSVVSLEGATGADAMSPREGKAKQPAFAKWSHLNLQRHNAEIDQRSEQTIWTVCLVRLDRTTLWCEAKCSLSDNRHSPMGTSSRHSGSTAGSKWSTGSSGSRSSNQSSTSSQASAASSDGEACEVIFSLRPVREGSPVPPSFVLVTAKSKKKEAADGAEARKPTAVPAAAEHLVQSTLPGSKLMRPPSSSRLNDGADLDVAGTWSRLAPGHPLRPLPSPRLLAAVDHHAAASPATLLPPEVPAPPNSSSCPTFEDSHLSAAEALLGMHGSKRPVK